MGGDPQPGEMQRAEDGPQPEELQQGLQEEELQQKDPFSQGRERKGEDLTEAEVSGKEGQHIVHG